MYRKIAMIGSAGSGKSTLLSLAASICRLRRVDCRVNSEWLAPNPDDCDVIAVDDVYGAKKGLIKQIDRWCHHNKKPLWLVGLRAQEIEGYFPHVPPLDLDDYTPRLDYAVDRASYQKFLALPLAKLLEDTFMPTPQIRIERICEYMGKGGVFRG